MKIVVLGAGGQLGRCFQSLQERNNNRQYLFFDRSDFDVSDPDAYRGVLDDIAPDVLINCAAYTKVDLAETEKEEAYKVNVLGPKYGAEYGARNDIPLIHISTDYVYGLATSSIPETHEIAPVNYYGQSKWEGEKEINRSGCQHLIIRTSWLYAIYGNNFVKTMLRLSENRDEINVVSDQIGSPTYAADLAEAVDHILHTSNDVNSIPWGTYNFANKGAVSWYEFAREILKDKPVFVNPIPTTDYPTPAERPKYSVLDVSLFEETFGWPIPEWKDGLKRCMKKI